MSFNLNRSPFYLWLIPLLSLLLTGFSTPSSPLHPFETASPKLISNPLPAVSTNQLNCPIFPTSVSSEEGLQTAINCFNGSPAGDYLITLNADISLTQNMQTILNLRGARLEIDGNNFEIDGNNTARIFRVERGDVTLRRLILRRGQGNLIGGCGGLSAINSCGGGIYLEGATLTLSNVELNDNSADIGAGLFNDGGNLTITESSFHNNFGGGLYNLLGQALISKSTFSENLRDGRGGSIYNTDSYVRIDESLFEGNSASNDGGGIYHSGTDKLIVNRSQFVNNDADEGGAIYNAGDLFGNVWVFGTIFSQNSASDGGGIYHQQGNLLIEASTFDGNSAGVGGGLFIAAGGLDLTRSTLSNNNAADGAGLYVLNGSITMGNSTLTGNSLDDGGFGGGGLSQAGGTTEITNSTIAANGNNPFTFGGGVRVDGGTLSLKNSLIVSNSSNSNCTGSGITADNSNFDTDGSCDNAQQKSAADINLGPLQDNGGPTQTMALLVRSDAIDAGDPTACDAEPVNNSDQRGAARSIGRTCDIGAFEAGLICAPFPYRVSNESELNEAISCYNIAPAEEYDIDISSSFLLSANTHPINNGSGAVLRISGNSFEIDGDNSSRIFNIEASKVTLDKVAITGGFADAVDNCLGVTGSRICGGGLHVGPYANVTLNQVIIDNNTSGQFGGGIANSGGELTISQSTFSNNTAENGGGIANWEGNVVFNSTILTANTSSNNGAGAINSTLGKMAFINSTVSNNVADSEGGGIDSLKGELYITGSTLSGNISGFRGGAIATGLNLTEITNSSILNNSSENGGGISTEAKDHLILDTVTLQDNSAEQGAGIYNADSELLIINSMLTTNIASVNGGGLYNSLSGDVEVQESQFLGNTAVFSGGGLHFGSGSLKMSNSEVSNNATLGAGSAPGSGGGIYVKDVTSDFDLINVTLVGNGSHNGGGIYANSSIVRVESSTLDSNTATGDGGGIYNLGNDALVRMIDSTISNNQAEMQGGGVVAIFSAVTSISNSTLYGNSAARGGGIDNRSTNSFLIRHVTIAENSATSGGGGIYSSNSNSLEVNFSLIANNTGGDCAGSPSLIGDNNFDSDGSCADAVQSSNLNLGPLLDNGGATETVALQLGSDAIDSILSIFCGEPGTSDEFDQRGVSRPQGVGCDAGAFEFEQPEATIIGTIELQGRGTPPNSLWAIFPQVLIYEATTNTLIGSAFPQTDVNGQFIMENAPIGDVKIAVTGPSTLQTVVPVTLTEGANTISFGLLKSGDINADNAISALDFSILASSFNLSLGDSGYVSAADLNADDAITALDFSLLASNFNQSGETVE
ncbi:MAG: choice-of-anchor Q domain-containing protein [Chloroflexota bacterium]